jgi:hypothetical protein
MNPLAGMSAIRLIYEMLPIFLAIIVLGAAWRAIDVGERTNDHLFFVLAAFNAFLLILAQTSWMWSVMVGERFGTVFADLVWSGFNTLVMVTYLMPAYAILRNKNAER